MLEQKWRVFILAFVTYGTIHSIRTAWAATKPQLEREPYDFSLEFVGVMDMIVLLCLAIALHLFGWLAGKWKVKLFLLGGMVGLVIAQTVFGFILLSGTSRETPYILVFGVIGFLSCTGWPSAFYIISKYFTKKDGLVLCIFNSASQLGDFIALISSQIIIKVFRPPANVAASSVVFSIAILTGIMIVVDMLFLHPKKEQPKNDPQLILAGMNELVQQNQAQPKKDNIQLQNMEAPVSFPDKYTPTTLNNGQLPRSALATSMGNIQEASKQAPSNWKRFKNAMIRVTSNNGQVNCLNVWCLPSVFSIVLAFSMIKSVNTLAADWLVDYFAKDQIGLSEDARLLSIAWGISLFFGGITCAIFNNSLSKTVFAIELLLAGISFIFLQQMDSHPSLFSMIVILSFAGFLFGGPYNLIATAVPLMLGDKEQIRNRPGAVASIIAVMQGGGQLMGALMMVLVPNIGDIYVPYVAAGLCLTSGLIVTYINIQEKCVISSLPVKTNSNPALSDPHAPNNIGIQIPAL